MLGEECTGGAAPGAIKLAKQDADRIEEDIGASVEEMAEGDLIAASEAVGLQSIELTEDDLAIITDPGNLA